ncbi:MAG TPA: hypothetical protein VHM89_12910 [Acidimicrobiales bacterium]|nr:hypothetical protein [Acidimicrobiales bacterium]
MPRAFLLVVTAVFCVLCVVPYAVAAGRTPAHENFSGLLLNAFDQNYYRAAQRSAAEALTQANRFTTEIEAPERVPHLYPLLGRVQRTTGAPSILVYHLPRVLAALVLPGLLFYLFALCFPGRPEPAMWATLFALFTAGVLTFAPGLSFAIRSGERIPESSILYSLSVFPHFAFSYVGLTLAFTALAKALRGHGVRSTAAVALLAGVVLGISHAFLVLPFAVVLFGFVSAQLAPAIRHRTWPPRLVGLCAVATIAVPAVPFVYGLHRVQRRLEELQGFTFPIAPSDSWWTWVLGFGLASVFAVAGSVWMVRRRARDPLTWMLLAWVAVQFFFVYAPFTVFQRRFSEGLVVPVAGMAGAGASLISGADGVGRALRVGLVATFAVGAIAISRTLWALGDYVPEDVVGLWATIDRSDVVLAGKELSPQVPAHSDGTSFVARPLETIHYQAKLDAAHRYAANPTSPESRSWLQSAGITTVVVMPDDGSFLPIDLDDPATCLRPVFRRPSLVAYRVQPECLRTAADAAPGAGPGAAGGAGG